MANDNTSPSYTWQTLGSVGTDQYPAATCVDQAGNLYALVWNPGTDPNQTQGGYLALWSPDSSEWINLGGSFRDLPPPLCADSSGNIYVGGDHTASSSNAILSIYNPTSKSWTAADSGLQGQITYVSCDSKNNVYAGGNIFDADDHMYVLIYNPAQSSTTAWTQVDCSSFTLTAPLDVCADDTGRIYVLYSSATPGLAYYVGGSWTTNTSTNWQNAAGIGCDDAGNVYFNTTSSVMSFAVSTATFKDLNASPPAFGTLIDFIAMFVDDVLYVVMYGYTAQFTSEGYVAAYSSAAWQNITPSGLNTNNAVALYDLAGNSSQSIFLASNQGLYAGTLDSSS